MLLFKIELLVAFNQRRSCIVFGPSIDVEEQLTSSTHSSAWGLLLLDTGARTKYNTRENWGSGFGSERGIEYDAQARDDPFCGKRFFFIALRSWRNGRIVPRPAFLGLPTASQIYRLLLRARPTDAPTSPDFGRHKRSFLLDAAPEVKPSDMQPWAALIYKQSADSYRNDTDGINCLPPGPKASISNGGGYPMKIVQTPGLIVILYEYQTLYRQVFMDGRDLPNDPNPTWMGYSIGHWEGDTLVVTTASYNDRTSLDLGGHPHTEALRVTERFHRKDAGHMDLPVTIDDPKAYTKSWTLPVDLDLVAGRRNHRIRLRERAR